MLTLIAFYRRAISPFLLPRCRFIPSCSEYAEEAIRAEGPIKGLYAAIKRIARCHPLGGGGLDPYEKQS